MKGIDVSMTKSVFILNRLKAHFGGTWTFMYPCYFMNEDDISIQCVETLSGEGVDLRGGYSGIDRADNRMTHEEVDTLSVAMDIVKRWIVHPDEALRAIEPSLIEEEERV